MSVLCPGGFLPTSNSNRRGTGLIPKTPRSATLKPKLRDQKCLKNCVVLFLSARDAVSLGSPSLWCNVFLELIYILDVGAGSGPFWQNGTWGVRLDASRKQALMIPLGLRPAEQSAADTHPNSRKHVSHRLQSRLLFTGSHSWLCFICLGVLVESLIELIAEWIHSKVTRDTTPCREGPAGCESCPVCEQETTSFVVGINHTPLSRPPGPGETLG